ncbi:NAD(P)-dependent oxidoreductase [bacterium]|nr:NAD(P)-dependent oxidoreductase [bacterium]
MMAKKVLITGGTGFIGKNVVNKLIESGYEVHSLVFPPFAPEQKSLFQYEMNLMDNKAVEEFLKEHKFENLIHLAWYVGKGCQTSPVNLDWVNLSLNLLKCFQENGGKRVLFTGSVSEYDYRYGYMTEDLTPLNNEYLYGKSKASLYILAKDFCEANGLDFKWARLFNVYGPSEREARLMPSVIISMLKGEDVKVSTCTKYQDYLHVEDIAGGIVALFESKIQNAVNICSGEPIKLRAIVEKIADLTNFKGNILWGAVPTYFEEPLVVGNNTKLKNEVGFSPKYSLDAGLKQTIDWWKGNLNVQ